MNQLIKIVHSLNGYFCGESVWSFLYPEKYTVSSVQIIHIVCQTPVHHYLVKVLHTIFENQLTCLKTYNSTSSTYQKYCLQWGRHQLKISPSAPEIFIDLDLIKFTARGLELHKLPDYYQQCPSSLAEIISNLQQRQFRIVHCPSIMSTESKRKLFVNRINALLDQNLECLNMSQLPVQSESTYDGQLCPICQEPMVIGYPYYQTQCNHDYHIECLLELYKSSTECSICKHSLKLFDLSD